MSGPEHEEVHRLNASRFRRASSARRQWLHSIGLAIRNHRGIAHSVADFDLGLAVAVSHVFCRATCFDDTGDPDRIVEPLDLDPLGMDDVDQLIGRGRRCVDAGADCWHEEKLDRLSVAHLERQDITWNANFLSEDRLVQAAGGLTALFDDFQPMTIAIPIE